MCSAENAAARTVLAGGSNTRISKAKNGSVKNMKQSGIYIKLITVVLLLAVLTYIGVIIYNSIANAYETTTAVSYVIDDTAMAQGYLIRYETVMTERGEAILPIAEDGQKVASGQPVAVQCMSSAAIETAGEVQTLKKRIARLESFGNEASSAAASMASVMELSKAVRRGDLRQLDELSFAVGTSVFSGSETASEELPALKARLEALELQTDGMTTILAPESGVFSQTVDGFEHIRPSGVMDITPSALNALFTAPSTVSGRSAVGKLITEFTWYFAAVIDASDASALQAGREVIIRFSGAYNTTVRMLIESINTREEGTCAVVFSCDRGIHEIASLRQLHAEVIFDSVSGLRVPKTAIQLDDDDGAAFVYLQTGVRAERVNVEILMEIGDSYLVRDGALAGTPLRDGSTIIVKANDLYDGKIVVG